ncbi:MAG: hypothetical protein L6R28_21705 [Planctomycetes bacterium]|nr:hypothetical protein [Planctomycetota bacterium]
MKSWTPARVTRPWFSESRTSVMSMVLRSEAGRTLKMFLSSRSVMMVSESVFLD